MRMRFLAIGAVLFAGGCSTCEVVEAELRCQTQRADCLQEQLESRDAELNSLRYTVESLQTQFQQISTGTMHPIETTAIDPRAQSLTKVRLGRLTGGRDLNGDGVDDALQVVVSPLDADGDVAKVPGQAQVRLTHVQPNGKSKLIGEWSVTDEELRSGWRTTMLEQGYQVLLPWSDQPASPNLQVEVEFTTADGRSFTSQKGIRVTLRPRSSSIVNRQEPADALAPIIEPKAANTRSTKPSAEKSSEATNVRGQIIPAPELAPVPVPVAPAETMPTPPMRTAPPVSAPPMSEFAPRRPPELPDAMPVVELLPPSTF